MQSLTLTQATQAANLWNSIEGDTLSAGDALDLMNGPEPEDAGQKRKRNVLLLVAAAIASAIAAAIGP